MSSAQASVSSARLCRSSRRPDTPSAATIHMRGSPQTFTPLVLLPGKCSGCLPHPTSDKSAFAGTTDEGAKSGRDRAIARNKKVCAAACRVSGSPHAAVPAG